MRVYEPSEKVAISRSVLEHLGAWFGIPKATEDYIQNSSEMPFFAAHIRSKTVGFVAIKRNSVHTAEIYVLGVLPEHQRKGIGRRLVGLARGWCSDNGCEFLQVKTLDESHPDPCYADTRRFYESVGFRILESLPQIWGRANPCVVMVMNIAKHHSQPQCHL